MIGRLRGLLASVSGTVALVEAGGIGYEVSMAPSSLQQLPHIGEEVVIHTHLHVREDLLELYGFTERRDRDVFRTLLTASGVGPRLALAVLGTLGEESLRHAISTEDTETLTLVPGIGKRSAQKLVLYLKGKLAGGEAELGAAPGSVAEIREALEGLGYQTAEIRDVLAGLPADEPVEDLLKMALQELGRR